MIHYIQEKDLQIEIFSTMAITNAAVFTMLLMFPVGEGEMASIEGNTVDREQRSPMIRVIKAPLHTTYNEGEERFYGL